MQDLKSVPILLTCRKYIVSILGTPSEAGTQDSSRGTIDHQIPPSPVHARASNGTTATNVAHTPGPAIALRAKGISRDSLHFHVVNLSSIIKHTISSSSCSINEAKESILSLAPSGSYSP